MPNEKPLEIYYFRQALPGFTAHSFRLNRENPSLDDVKNAKIVEKTTPRSFYAAKQDRFKSFGSIEYIHKENQLEGNFDPYGIGRESEYRPKQGIGLHFELRVLKHLQEVLGNGTVKIKHKTIWPNRIEMLRKMGIDANGASHTLDGHIELYEKRIKEIEERLKREH